MMDGLVIPEVTEELVEEAAAACAEYVGTLEEKYQQRSALRARKGFPVIGYMGWGRSGKDEAAQILARCSELQYGGSTSTVATPLIASALGISEEQAFAERHDNRMFWFDFCNMYRRKRGGDVLARYLLGLGDIVAGLRDREEIYAVSNNHVVTHLVWVERPGVPCDPTVAYDWPLIQKFGGCRLMNDGDLPKYEETVKSHARMAGIEVK